MQIPKFRRIAAGHYIDDESGVQITQGDSGRWFVYTSNGARREHLAASGATLAKAKVAAKSVIRRETDHAEALVEYAERAETPTPGDETVHLWTAMTDAPSLCGVDILSTPYTFGTPEIDQATCPACIAKHAEYREELAAELGKFARGEDPYPYEPTIVITEPLTHAATVDEIRARWRAEGHCFWTARLCAAMEAIRAATGVTEEGARVLLLAESTAALADDR